MNLALVFLFGCLVGAAELISRHSDHRLRAISTVPSLAYLLLNGLMSVFALLVINYVRPEWLGYKTDASGIVQSPESIWLILAAGFSGATFFRSSVFKLKTPDGDMSIGPAIIIDVFLNVIDESVDRIIGQQRLIEVSAIMDGVNFDKAAKNLPTFSFAALRRLSPDAQQQFAFQLKQLADRTELDPKVRSISLGLSIMNLTGKPILTQAVTQLGDTIK
ncbi:MAG: hypothetical protein P4L76_08560 [Beijerinckiaceae bacterium]|nr:hypothetical protein [Beijerinckiaceae bacterium]